MAPLSVSDALSKDRPRLRAEVGDWRKQPLIRSSRQCIDDVGRHKATVEELTVTAKVSRGLTRHYFMTKSEFVQGACAYLCTDFRTRASDARRSSRSPRDRLLALIDITFKPPYFELTLVSAWFNFWVAARNDRALYKIYRSYFQWYRQHVLELFESLAEQPAADLDIKSAVDEFMALMDGLCLQLSLDPSNNSTRNAQRVCRAHVAMVFRLSCD